MLGFSGYLIFASGNIRGRSPLRKFSSVPFTPCLFRSLLESFAGRYIALSSACCPLCRSSVSHLPCHGPFPRTSGFVGTEVSAQQPIVLPFGGQPTALLGLLICWWDEMEDRGSQALSPALPCHLCLAPLLL